MSHSLQPHGLPHARLPCPSLSPRVCSNSCPLSQWCHLTISSCVIPFSCPQSFPASKSFPMSWLSASGAQNTGTSASVLPINIQGWFPLGLTGLISLLSQGVSRVFSSTPIRKHQLIIWCLAFFMDDFYIFVLWKHRSEWPLSGLALMTSYLLSSFFFQNPKPSSFLAESSLVCQWVDRKTFSSQ